MSTSSGCESIGVPATEAFTKHKAEAVAALGSRGIGEMGRRRAIHRRLMFDIGFTILLVVVFPMACALHAEPGLVAHYTFEEGPGSKVVKDWAGQGNDGTITGKATYVKLEGERGYALRFNDGRAYVNCGNHPSLDLSDAVTIELWFYPETAPAGGTEPGLVGKGLGSYALTYVARGACWWYIGGGGNGVSAGGVPPTSSWHHIAATFDGRDSKIYVDGEPAGARALERKINTGGGAFYLRYPVLYGGDKDLPFTCMMDDVRVYNRALSADELLRHYKQDRNWRQGREVEAGKMSVTPRVYAALSKLRVEVDLAGLQPIPAGTTVTVEWFDPIAGSVIDRRQTAEWPASDKLVAVFDTSKTLAGDYEIRTIATDGNGKQVGSVSSVHVSLPQPKPARPQAAEGTRALNNLVTELLNVQAPERAGRRQYRFTHPRDGWVFIGSEAKAGDGGKVRIALDSAPKEDAVIVHEEGKPQILEAMRHVSAGEHTLDVHSEGGALNSLVVRAIPEIQYAENGYPWSPFLPGMGPYTVEFMERIGLLDDLNVVLERHPVEPFAQHWRQQGKKVLMHAGTHQLHSDTADGVYELFSKLDGFQRPDRDGIMFDELSGESNLAWYPGLSGGVRRLSENPQYRGKVLYPYCTSLYASEPSTTFSWEIVEAGYKLAEEKYLPEQPTVAAAQEFLDARLTQVMSQYQAIIPNCQEHMIMVLGYMSAPPESLNTNPSVDYKVWLDMQFNLLANNPAFRGLYGVQCYHAAYADEEIIRWSAKLFRHYCIEGRRERLSKDPYILPHLQNPDFADGTMGWTLSPAETGSMDTRSVPDYSYLQGRYPKTSQGDTVLWTRRSAKGPNRFSQEITDLVPGKLYSLKMFTADYQHFISGKGVASFQAVEAKREMSIGISDADLVPSESFENAYASGICGHTGKGFTRENNLPIAYRFLVFRPRSEKAMLTISDWADDKEPGGPVGQELMHNFIEVQPYLED